MDRLPPNTRHGDPHLRTFAHGGGLTHGDDHAGRRARHTPTDGHSDAQRADFHSSTDIHAHSHVDADAHANTHADPDVDARATSAKIGGRQQWRFETRTDEPATDESATVRLSVS